MYLSDRERMIVIRALQKVIDSEPPYARADEYKKLLDRMKEDEEIMDNPGYPDGFRYHIDEV